MNIPYLGHEQAHLGATENSSSSHSLAIRPAPILAALISNLVARR